MKISTKLELEKESVKLHQRIIDLEESLNHFIKDKGAGQDIRKTHDYLENLINYANAPIIIWDPGFIITCFNHAFEHLTGYKSNDVIGKELTLLFPETSRKKSMNRINATSNGKHWESVEIPILCKDKNIKIALWNSANIYASDGKTLVSTIAQGTDITENKRKEEQINKTKAELENILNTTPIHIASIDINGKYTSWNMASEEMFGFTAEKVIGKLTPRRFHRNDKEAKTVIETAKKKGKFENDIILKRKNGSEFHAHLLVSKIIDSSGDHIGYTGVAVDISERKQVEKIQLVLYNIAKAVNTTTNMDELYKTIHQLLSTVIDTSSFYIANYNEDTDEITASYFIDKKVVLKVPFQLRKNGVTNYIIKNKKSLFLTEELRKELIDKGEIADYVGTSKTLLGVPLRIDKKIIGCIVVRSYKEKSKFSEKDISILELASNHIAIAIARKQAEETLIENEEKYRILIEKNQDGVFLIQDGLMKLTNPAFASMIGYTVQELINMDFRKLIVPEDVKIVTDRYNKRQAGENIASEYEFKMLCKDGKTPVDVSINAGIIKFKGKVASIGTIHNITKRKQLQKESEKLFKESETSRTSLLSILEDVTEKEAALHVSQERFQDVVNNSGDWIWETDKKGRYTYCSPVVKQVLGYEYKEILGKYFYDLFPQDECDKLKKNVFEIFKKKENIHNLINRNVHKDGGIAFLETSAVPLLDDKDNLLGYRGVDRDITERIQAKKIQETLYNISNALNTTEKMHDLYSKIREYLGNIIDTTNFYVALYDEKTDMISLPFDVDEKDNYETFPAGKTLTSFVIKTGKPLFADEKLQDELTMQGKIDIVGTPSKIWLGVPLIIENNVIGVIAIQSYDNPNLYTEKDIEILTFISEEIAIAIKHKQAEEQIKNNLKEKDTLLRELYHRTKNNMQIITSMLRIQSTSIESKSLTNSTGIDFLHDSFNDVINKIKSMSLVHQKLYQSQDLSHINLKEYIKDLVRLLMISYRVKSEKTSLELELENVLVLIDLAMPLGLVLNELISNVFKHAFSNNENDTISIRLYKEEDDTINIHLSDNGVGIPKDIDLENVNTMGLQTVFDLIKYQLKGEVTYKTENGLKWHLRLKDNMYSKRV